MPSGALPGVAAPVVCCDLGRVDPHHPLPPGLRPYRDAFGFTYRLCEEHYAALTHFLLTHEGLRHRTKYHPRPDVPRRPHVEPTRAERAAAPVVSGAELIAARLARGWSQRELAAALGVSRAQVAGSETGRRPVSPPVARWVVKQGGILRVEDGG